MNSLPDYVSKADRVILFDGICVLCTGWVRFLLKNDKQRYFKLASVQSKEGQELLRYADMPTDAFETLLVIDQGKVLLRSDAVLLVLTTLGMPWSLAAIFNIIPKVVRDFFYHHIATNRYTLFGKREACYLPMPDDLSRFLKSSHD